MQKRAGLAALILVLLLGAAWRVSHRGDSSVEARVEESSTLPNAPTQLSPNEPREPARSSIPSAEKPAEEPASSPGGTAPAEQRTGPQLEVLVTFEGEPLAAAAIEIFPFEEFSEFLVGGDAGESVARATTGLDGVAHFQPLAASTYGILAAAPTGEQARTRIVLTPDPAKTRIGIALGRAALEGTVHDLDGNASLGSRVIARQNPRPGEAAVWFATKTGASGAYRLDGIAGGAGRSVLAAVIDLPLGEALPFEIALGETRRLDFGSQAGRASWSGVVRYPSGAPLAGPAWLCFTAGENTASKTGSFDERGRFKVVLPPGTYTAHLNGPAGLVLGRAEVAGAIEQDLAAPRVVLRGRIRYVGTKQPIAKGPEHDASIALERDPAGQVRIGFLRGDSEYAFCGLEPGSYVLTTSPWIVSGTADGRTAVVIGPGTDEMELDLAITDP